MFAADCDESAAIINELLGIRELNSSPRRIIVVTMGSSLCLRRLCFGTASNDDKLRYRTYKGKRFNDHKYTCSSVDALLNVAEHHDAKRILIAFCANCEDSDGGDDVECHVDSTHDEPDYTYCMDELSLTRGVMQGVVDINNRKLYYEHRQIVGFTEERNDPMLQKLWRALVAVLRNKSDTELQKAICNDRHWAALSSATFAGMQGLDSSITLSGLYEWVGRGFIGLADVHVDTNTARHVVTFVHSVDLMWAVTNLS